MKQDLVSKLINAKSAGGVTQVAQHMPSKHKALRSNSCATKNKIK
jgi:hypothetical protein